MTYVMHRTDISNLERELESGVLTKYDLLAGKTIWHSHDTVGPDDMVHYFSRGTQKYVLVWNDHPNATFIHEENLPPALVIGGQDEWLHIKTGDLKGYYSLYKDY